MSTRKVIAAFAIGCVIAMSSGIALAASEQGEKPEARSFPITEKWSMEKLLENALILIAA